MVASGAKGSLVNHAMIAVGLGQQEVRTPGRKSVVRTDGRAGGRGGTRSEQHRGRPSHPPPLPSSPNPALDALAGHRPPQAPSLTRFSNPRSASTWIVRAACADVIATSSCRNSAS
jgi:hypothetical protein